MCTDKSNDENQTNITSLPFHSSFLNCWKTAKPTTLKFLDFQFVTGSKYVGGNRVNWTYWAFWYIDLQTIFHILHSTNNFTCTAIYYL